MVIFAISCDNLAQVGGECESGSRVSPVRIKHSCFLTAEEGYVSFGAKAKTHIDLQIFAFEHWNGVRTGKSRVASRLRRKRHRPSWLCTRDAVLSLTVFRQQPTYDMVWKHLQSFPIEPQILESWLLNFCMKAVQYT